MPSRERRATNERAEWRRQGDDSLDRLTREQVAARFLQKFAKHLRRGT